MSIYLAIFLIFIVPFLFPIISECVFSIIGKKYTGRIQIKRCMSFWSWMYWHWNYIGGTPIVRHIGVRWFGFEFERTEEILDGELRF